MSATFFCSSCFKYLKPDRLHSVKKLGKNNKRHICISCNELMNNLRAAQKVRPGSGDLKRQA